MNGKVQGWRMITFGDLHLRFGISLLEGMVEQHRSGCVGCLRARRGLRRLLTFWDSFLTMAPDGQ